MCRDPYVGYSERSLRVALEICRIGVLSVAFSALVTVVLDSACRTDSLVLCVGSLCNCMLSLYCYRSTWSGQVCTCRQASVVWLLRAGCYVLTSGVVCVGAMDTCGFLKTGLGGGGGLWLVGFQKCVDDLVGEDS